VAAEPAVRLGSADTARTYPLEVPSDHPAAGLTVAEVARRYRVGEDKVRAWIARGELKAINTAAVLCGRPRWVVPPEALAEFEKARRGSPAPKPQRQRRRRAQEIDFYPD
jgi:excisionase family DNA binding protein